MNQEKIKIEAYNEALEIVNKYKHEKKRLSLKQKGLYKKSKKIVEEYENQLQQSQESGENNSKKKQKDQLSAEDRFHQDRTSIFDTKKGQVLFELQKSYKGDERFKLDRRFAEDVDAQKIPNSMRLLTTGIDFQNLSDGSDYEFKKKQSKQKKLQKKQEKQLLKAEKLNAIKNKEDEQSQSSSGSDASDEDQEKQVVASNGKGIGGLSQNNQGDDDSDSDFFTIKTKKNDSTEKGDEAEDGESDKKKGKDKKKKQSKDGSDKQVESKKRKRSIQADERIVEEADNNADDADSINLVKFDEEDLQDDDGGQDFRKAWRVSKDYIDQEALAEDEVQEVTMEEELHSYLKILQDLMPDEKLFFQNKKKNVKVINNSFAGYATMLTQVESQQIAGKKKKKSKEERMDRQAVKDGEHKEGEVEEEENEEDQKSNAKKGFDKDFNISDDEVDDQFGIQKREKAYNLVIPRFDPSQLVVKKVMQAQEREKMEKLKELESKKKPKKMSVEAKIEAGIDKKLQKIMKANSILDKNLTEHKKLEGVVEVKKKAPVLKKIKIDADKWKDIINEASAPHGDNENGNQSKATEQQKPQEQSKQNNQSNNRQNQPAVVQPFRQPLFKQGPSTLGMLFASVPATSSGDASRSQFKLFG